MLPAISLYHWVPMVEIAVGHWVLPDWGKLCPKVRLFFHKNSKKVLVEVVLSLLGLYQDFSLAQLRGREEVTAPPDPLLNWTLVQLWFLSSVCNSKNAPRPNICYFDHWVLSSQLLLLNLKKLNNEHMNLKKGWIIYFKDLLLPQ